MAKCRSCGAEIFWLSNVTTGRLMPVDATPDTAKGNVKIDGPKASVLGLEAATQERQNGVLLHLNHFATCPNAKSHKKGK